MHLLRKYLQLQERYRYLGAIPKIGETLWYVATYQAQWIALVSFSVATLKCTARDQWIGWSYRHQTGRLKLTSNNSRFLILPVASKQNLGSRVLSLCLKRLSDDWVEKYGHPVLLVETFVDPERFYGGVYRASNRQALGIPEGFVEQRRGYSTQTEQIKLIFVKSLHRRTQAVLSQPQLSHHFNLGEIKMKITTQQMRSLPSFFKDINDPRRSQGRRHRLSTVLG